MASPLQFNPLSHWEKRDFPHFKTLWCWKKGDFSSIQTLRKEGELGFPLNLNLTMMEKGEMKGTSHAAPPARVLPLGTGAFPWVFS